MAPLVAPRLAKVDPIVGPFGGKSSVFVIQAAYEAYAEKMKSLMEISTNNGLVACNTRTN